MNTNLFELMGMPETRVTGNSSTVKFSPIADLHYLERIQEPFLRILREQIVSQHFTIGTDHERIQWLDFIHKTNQDRLELDWAPLFNYDKFGGGICKGCKRIFLGSGSFNAHDLNECKISEIHNL